MHPAYEVFLVRMVADEGRVRGVPGEEDEGENDEEENDHEEDDETEDGYSE